MTKHIIYSLFSTALVWVSCNNTVEKNNPVAPQTDTITEQKPVTKPRSCSEIVMEILTTSARYQEISNGLADRVIKNGGTGFGFDLDGSPNPDQDSALNYSKTYDISLHETYPDHNPVIANFVFDKSAGRLYEYAVAADTLKPIPFNRQLLTEISTACK